MLPNEFICKSHDYSTLERSVNAPYIRRRFNAPEEMKAKLVITGLGFYDAFINGKRITKGLLAPYVSAPDDIVDYDEYEFTAKKGENVLGLILGNGMQNSFCGYVWDFEKAAWRASPETAFEIRVGDAVFTSGTGCKCFDSPITFDDERGGEFYDARLEIKGWSEPGFDDSGWSDALPAREPKGEKRFCIAEPITTQSILKPLSVKQTNGGWLYDFGVNAAGNPRLTMKGTRGQTVTLYCGELLVNGDLTQENIKCDRNQQCQVMKYTFSGDGTETYTPHFTYSGFRYVKITGVTAEQATPDALEYLVQNSDLRRSAEFECSDETVNKLAELSQRSTLANFWYFPTDCPHREKNGWTGDAAVSAEQTIMQFKAENSYAEWLAHIRAVQREDGALPGIIPTGGWGFKWGSGPAWDCVIAVLPYYIYLYRRDKAILRDNADAIDSYLTYMSTKLLADGTTAYGLGDWCSPNRPSGDPKTPLGVTDTLMCADICKKASYIFGQLGQTERRARADTMYCKLISAFRNAFVDTNKCSVRCLTQTAQSMALYYGVFTEGEYAEAYTVLKKLISDNDGQHDCGILGCRVIFNVLADNGDADLALSMITSKAHPGFGNWIDRGATSLWENFPKEDEPFLSLNHHFFGAISGFFFRYIAGIQVGEEGVRIEPKYPSAITHAKAKIDIAGELVSVEWTRSPDGAIVQKIQR
ncbi:MAG TPA: family 78 glycoside hydrolase catalytic domain [Bacillota bacterium]|nr:family 78 glycoside hydrolase catalytic domain [Bacillota bacterium]